MSINLAMLSLLGFIISFVIVYVSIPSIVNVARIKGLFDEPGLRKCHHYKVPNLGGIAIFAAIIIAMGLLVDMSDGRELVYLLASVTVMFFVGIKDDILIIAPSKKLLGEIISVLIVVILGDLRFTSLHGFLGINEIDYMSSILLSCFVMVVIVNGFNLIDGIDGLAAGIGIVVSLTFGMWFSLVGLVNYAVLSAIVTGSLIAFFRFNVFGGANKIFMGDTGSLILGLIASVFVIRFNEVNLVYDGPFAFHSAPAVSFGILIIPLVDTLRVFILRISRGQSPFHPDMNHLHHRILKLGVTHVEATVIIATTNLFFIIMMLTCKSMGLLPLMGLNLAVALVLLLVLELFIKIHRDRMQKNMDLDLKPIEINKVKSA